MLKKIGLIFMVGALLVVFSATTGLAQKFPAKDITLIVPWAAGGGTDTIARALVKNAKKYFGVNVNVANKTGGMGAVGMGAAATAVPDGYTIGLITFQLSTYRMMGLADLSYRDYQLIQLLNQSYASISVAPDSKFKTLKDLMEYAKKNPGIVTAGHSGAGGGWHLALASIALQEKIKFNFVPFDGAAPTRIAVVGGHIAVATTGMDEVLQLYRAGQLRILAVNATKRHWLFPDVPTIAEAGYPNPKIIYDWRGLGTPKGVPADRMEILIKGFKNCFEDPEFKKLAHDLGLPLAYRDPKGFEEFLKEMEETLRPALDSVGLLKEKK
ncbi:MAG: tripartite tricarboxylate transporter substrate binding protein [Deltaproteobacteria bacterium]|nr:tripartite tricarboxylate transporter substrate binding protein [Deltaproteobacteria bacterium]